MEISLSGALPRGDGNGLGVIVKSLIREPEKIHALVVLVDTTKLVTHVDTGETIPVLRIRRAEVIRDEDLKEAERLVRRAWEQRNGDTVLPLEMEDDLRLIFDSVVEPEPEKPEEPAAGPDDEGEDDGDANV
jgi:hypothetical protein